MLLAQTSSCCPPQFPSRAPSQPTGLHSCPAQALGASQQHLSSAKLLTWRCLGAARLGGGTPDPASAAEQFNNLNTLCFPAFTSDKEMASEKRCLCDDLFLLCLQALGTKPWQELTVTSGRFRTQPWDHCWGSRGPGAGFGVPLLALLHSDAQPALKTTQAQQQPQPGTTQESHDAA